MGASHDIQVQCTRCRNKHMESERVAVRTSRIGSELTCPRCGGRSYYDLTPQVAWTWASGLIEWGDEAPEGSIVIAKGPKSSIKAVLEVVARHGHERGVLLVPGVPEAENQRAGVEALDKWLAWCSKGNGNKHRHGVEFIVPKGAADACTHT